MILLVQWSPEAWLPRVLATEQVSRRVSDGVHVVVPLWPWCREAVLHLTGWRHQGFYGSSSQRARAALSIPDVLARVQKVRGLLLAESNCGIGMVPARDLLLAE